MPAEDNNFDLYGVGDLTPSIRGSEDISKEEGSDNDHYLESSAFGFNTSRLDNMLEVLPDDLGFHVTSFNGTESGESHNAVEGLVPPSRPIDIASCPLSDEIAPMWDFKVEDFMMTPTPVEFNSSGPNSFNSNRYLHHSESAPSGQCGSFINNISGGLGLNSGMEHLNSSQSTSSSPKTETSGKNNNNNSAHVPSIGYRKASNHFSKTIHTEDGGIALSSSATMNSVRKNQLTRQVSSTSLSNYKRGSSSGISDLPKKPPIQCYNCKTNKTPLWRRDPQGNTMCNACGLFQKLHGTMRPLSLKSDVIKKRNTKKRSEREKQAQESSSQSNSNSKNFGQSLRRNMKKSISENGEISNNIGGLPLLPQALPMTETNFDFGITAHRMTSQQSQSQNERQQQYSSAENLNPNSLMDHNKKMATSNSQHSRKSRRSSTSSNNSNSSKSSSRSVVPILPKPSPSALQFNLSYNGSSNSAGNSTSSSPRVFPGGCNPDSSMNTWQQNAFSSSPGKIGVSIPRRKSSRNHASSSSFMAASLYQLQQHHQKQEQQQQQQSSNIQMGDGNFSGWNSGSSQVSIGYSNSPTTRSPKGAFDYTASSVDSSANRNISRKPHTSLLSQQLQNSTWHSAEVPSHRQEQQESYTADPRSSGTSQPAYLRSISAAASPCNGYDDTLLQRRGIREDRGSSFRRQNSIWPRKNGCIKEQAVSSNNEVSTLGNTVTLTASPTLSAIASPAAAAPGESSSDGHKNIAEEFGWLKFNM